MRDTLFEERVERDEPRKVAEEAMNASLGTTMFGIVCTKVGREIAYRLVPETRFSQACVKRK